MAEPVIQAKKLTKFYGRSRGVIDLDLAVRSGEVFGFLGPNGAGKTTTIRLLLDFIRPTSGRSRVLGLDSRHDSLAIRHQVGYLPGDLRLYESLSGRELITFFGGLRGGLNWGRVNELAERLDSDLGREIRNLSHGNRQKLGLITALMSDPPVLFLDEPTNGLDPLVQRAFCELVEGVRQEGRTVFLSSHVLPEVERLCDRVAMIREGRLLTVASMNDLKQRALRRLELVFADRVPAAAFAGVPGIQELVVEDSTLRCSVVGSVDPLMKAANRFEILNVVSIESTLEDVFMAFYRPGSGPAAEASSNAA